MSHEDSNTSKSQLNERAHRTHRIKSESEFKQLFFTTLSHPSNSMAALVNEQPDAANAASPPISYDESPVNNLDTSTDAPAPAPAAQAQKPSAGGGREWRTSMWDCK